MNVGRHVKACSMQGEKKMASLGESKELSK